MCLEISNDFGPLIWLLPATPVDHQADPDDPSPLLRPHYRASALLRDGPPPCPATVLCPSRRCPLGDLPLAASPPGRRQYRGDRFPRSVQEPRPGSRRLHAGRHLGSQQAPPRLVPGSRSCPGFDATEIYYDTSTAVRFRSPSRPTPDAITAAPFPQRSPRTALNRRSLRWFEASPCRATPEDLPPSPAQHRIQWLLHACLLQRPWHTTCRNAGNLLSRPALAPAGGSLDLEGVFFPRARRGTRAARLPEERGAGRIVARRGAGPGD